MKEPDILPEDHEEWENEYYARRSSGGIVGFVAMIGMIMMMAAMLIINLIKAIV